MPSFLSEDTYYFNVLGHLFTILLVQYAMASVLQLCLHTYLYLEKASGFPWSENRPARAELGCPFLS